MSEIFVNSVLNIYNFSKFSICSQPSKSLLQWDKFNFLKFLFFSKNEISVIEKLEFNYSNFSKFSIDLKSITFKI